ILAPSPLLPDLSQHASCQPRRPGRSWCTSGSRIGGFLVSAVWRSGDVNRGPAHGYPRDEDRGGASLLVLARGDLSIGLARRMQVARSIGTSAQLSCLEKRGYRCPSLVGRAVEVEQRRLNPAVARQLLFPAARRLDMIAG